MVLKFPAKTKKIIFVILIICLSTVGYSFYLSYNYNRGFLPIGLKYKNTAPIEKSNYSDIRTYLYDYHKKYQALSSKDISTVDSWNYKEDLFQAEVLSVDIPSNALTIRMAPPASNIHSESLKVSVKCQTNESIILDPMLSPVQFGSQVMLDIKTSYTLYSFCLNEQCSEIGRACLFGPAE